MAHKCYPNFYLSSEVSDQFDTHLDLQTFFKVDNNLEGTAGMKRIINVYSATDNTINVAMGEGNEDSIEVTYDAKEYEILTAQNRFVYYDEQEMTDPNVVPVGMQRMGTGLFNKVNADFLEELAKATLSVQTEKFDFDSFVDAVAKINVETTDNDPQDIPAFAFISPLDIAEVRKELKDDLKYVEAYSRTGYVGTCAGVNLYVSKAINNGIIYVATKDAVTLFNKKGVEIEQDRDINIRENEVVSRKYYIVALTDATKAVKIVRTDKVTVAGADEKTYWNKTTSEIQSDVTVSDNAIYGTSHYLADGVADSGPLSGAGNFIAVKFVLPSGITYSDVQVKLENSASGMGWQTLDSDLDAVFKISDAVNQNLIVRVTKAGHEATQKYDLSRITYEKADETPAG